MTKFAVALLALSATTALATPSFAQESWFSGNWSLTLGVAALSVPDYEGADDYRFVAQPIVSFGRQGTERRFSSRNDNISIGLFDNGIVRAGPTGKVIFERDGGDSDDLIGLDPIRFGGELGGFAEYYATDWLRLRGEVRHGIRSHDGIVADVAADAFMNLTPTIQISGGPRVSYASADYFDAYYGVSGAEALASGLTPYSPESGFRSVGVGAAINWDVTDKIQTSLFGEYARLVGPAADSSLVNERGDENQFTIGVSATYRFDFSL